MNLAEALVSYAIEADIDADDLITDVVILAKVHAADGTTTLLIGAPDGRDWISQFGLMAAAWTSGQGGALRERVALQRLYPRQACVRHR